MAEPAHYERVKEICRDIYKDTMFSSRFATDHRLYKELVEMGKEVVPALLRRVDDFKAHAEITGTLHDELSIWEPLMALSEITGVQPSEKGGVEREGGFVAFRLPVLMDWWLAWGEEEGLEWRD